MRLDIRAPEVSAELRRHLPDEPSQRAQPPLLPRSLTARSDGVASSAVGRSVRNDIRRRPPQIASQMRR